MTDMAEPPSKIPQMPHKDFAMLSAQKQHLALEPAVESMSVYRSPAPRSCHLPFF